LNGWRVLRLPDPASVEDLGLRIDRPVGAEAIIEACGVPPPPPPPPEAVDYPAKIKCCAFPIIQAAANRRALAHLIQNTIEACDGGRCGRDVLLPACTSPRLVPFRAALTRRARLPHADPPPAQLIVVAAGFEESERLRVVKAHVGCRWGLCSESGSTRALAGTARGWRGSKRVVFDSRRADVDVTCPACRRIFEGLGVAHLPDFHLGQPAAVA